MSRHLNTAGPAHGPNTDCAACTDCTSCEGGTARIPAYFRVTQRATQHAGIALHAVCTGCEGRGATCPNLAHHDRLESA